MRQCFYIEKYDWQVVVWYLDGEKNDCTNEICKDLRNTGCNGFSLNDAMRLVKSMKINNAFTYSNLRTRKSIIVIDKTTSAEEFANSCIHERKHLESHIGKMFSIDPYSEEAAYLSGDIGGRMFRFSHVLLCEDCRESYLSRSE